MTEFRGCIEVTKRTGIFLAELIKMDDNFESFRDSADIEINDGFIDIYMDSDSIDRVIFICQTIAMLDDDNEGKVVLEDLEDQCFIQINIGVGAIILKNED